MMVVPVGIGPSFSPDYVVRALAVLGGALLAGFLLGFILGFVIKIVTTKTIPPWLRNVLRLAGAIAGGWLVALFVFSSGGDKLGGSGGGLFGGNGEGNGKKEDVKTDKEVSKTDDKKDSDKGKGDDKLVEIVVLGPKPLKARFGDNPDYNRCYAVAGGDEVHNLDGIQGVIRARRKKTDDLKVDIVLYKDSPDKGTELVAELFNWLNDEKLFRVLKTLADKEAPRK